MLDCCINMLFLPLCVSRFGLKTAVPSAVSSSSRAVASPSPALLRRRLPRFRNPASLILFLTHRAPTAPPLASRAPAWPRAPAPETPRCPSGAQPSRPCPTPWPPPLPPACSGPHLTQWATASRRPTPRATPAPPPTSPAWTAVPICPPCTRSCQALWAPWAPSPCPPWGAL